MGRLDEQEKTFLYTDLQLLGKKSVPKIVFKGGITFVPNIGKKNTLGEIILQNAL